MPASYSKDFRQKVMSYVKRGNSCNRASIKFEISANTVRNWYKRYKSEGHYLSKKVGGKKGRVTPQEIAAQEIATYIKTNPDFILSDIGNHFKMTAAGAHYWLKKLGYSYKKNFASLEASEEKRAKYKEELKDKAPESLVYIDESFIEFIIYKDRSWGKKSEKLTGKKSGKYYKRTNIIAVYVDKQSVAPTPYGI